MKNQKQTQEAKSHPQIPEELNYNDRPDGYGLGESVRDRSTRPILNFVSIV